MKMLITGAKGMLGSRLFELWSKSGYEIIGVDKDECDITNQEEVLRVFDYHKPDIVVHCAALIDVDYCEKNKVKCYDTNVHGTENIAIACDLRDIYLVYISSSMVFDGDAIIAYTENMEANPINMYSLSKYLGERYIIDGNEGLVVRTNIIGESKGFFKWIYDSVKKGEKIKLYKDLYFNTIYINTFADCLKKLIDKREKGLYHIASKDYMSKYEFGKLVESVFGLQGNIVSISYNSVIPRPKKAVLNCSKYEKEFGKLPTIKETLKKIKESM